MFFCHTFCCLFIWSSFALFCHSMSKWACWANLSGRGMKGRVWDEVHLLIPVQSLTPTHQHIEKAISWQLADPITESLLNDWQHAYTQRLQLRRVMLAQLNTSYTLNWDNTFLPSLSSLTPAPPHTRTHTFCHMTFPLSIWPRSIICSVPNIWLSLSVCRGPVLWDCSNGCVPLVCIQ